MVDQEAVETVSGAVEVAGGDEAAEESQEVDESQEANAVPEDPMEEEAEPENEADDAPIELEEEAVPATRSSPGKQSVRHVKSKK